MAKPIPPILKNFPKELLMDFFPNSCGSYFLRLLIASAPTRAANPVPRSSIVAGSGTAGGGPAKAIEKINKTNTIEENISKIATFILTPSLK
jgi:hypothetical protein